MEIAFSTSELKEILQEWMDRFKPGTTIDWQVSSIQVREVGNRAETSLGFTALTRLRLHVEVSTTRNAE